MQARTKKPIASTENSEVNFHFDGTIHTLLLAEDAARNAYSLLAGLARNNVRKSTDKAVDALPFARQVQQDAGGSEALTLRVLRRRAGMTQAKLAKAVGMRAPHLSLMESGKRKITAAKAKSLARVLGCDWRRLFTDDL